MHSGPHANLYFVRFEVLRAVVLKIPVFWYVTRRVQAAWPANKDSVILRNVGNYLPDMASHPARLETSICVFILYLREAL
jgi:hypothetical protein